MATNSIDRILHAYSRFRTFRSGGEAERYRHVISMLLRKVRFSKENMERFKTTENLKDIVTRKYIEALQFAKKISEKRKIYYYDRYPIDIFRVAEILVEAKRLDGPLLIATVLQPLLRPRKAAWEDPNYLEEVKPFL